MNIHTSFYYFMKTISTSLIFLSGYAVLENITDVGFTMGNVFYGILFMIIFGIISFALDEMKITNSGRKTNK